MDNAEVAKRYAKENNALAIVHEPPWESVDVWQMLFYDPDDEKVPTVGIPQFIFISEDGSVRGSDDDEAMAYMQYIQGTEEDETEEIIRL